MLFLDDAGVVTHIFKDKGKLDTRDDLWCLHFSCIHMWQTIDNVFSIISGGQAGIINERQ